MNDKQQIQAFADDLDNLIERYRREFDLSYAGVVGALHMKAYIMCKEASNQEEEE